MKRQFDPDEGISQWKRLLDALFGGAEDIDPEEAGQILASAGFEYGELRKRMYAKLAAKAASFRLEGKAVPQALAEALEVFRPEDAPPRN